MRPRGKTNSTGKSPKGQKTTYRNTPQRKSSRASTRITQAFPKKSAYFANKTKSSPAPKVNVNNSSKGTPIVKTTPKTKSIGNTVTKNDVCKKDGGKTENSSAQKPPSPRKESIFVTPPRNFNEIAADVIRADCMNHGYRIEKIIGEGAYAKVKLAEVLQSKLARNPDMNEQADDDGNLKVAIKVIEAKNVPKEFLEKFLPRELENHCPMPSHKNVVRVFEHFRTSDRHYVVMEYCSHGDLLDLINSRISESRKGLGEDRVRSLFRMLADGMHHIHTNGIVHRDLKCENVLLDKESNIKITDFGFSTRFIPGQSSLLRTSCGSYAYTAPEVIKSKAYDGTKSDVWSLGIILFAMLNGRLPFNDAQLGDLEEDMKMQRLRFERSVSFESMVLVRRILQYNPSNRPSTADILNDTWLTGKRLIPRQSNKPKWTNSYQSNPPSQPCTEILESAMVCSNPVYYKSTLPERGSEATVTLNHEKNETVTLKSRTRNKKNIWITGPAMSHRPNTWPRSDKSTGQPTQTRETTRGKSRGSSACSRRSPTTVVVKPPDSKKRPGKPESKARVSTNTIQLSKWFMEKYMAGKEENKGKKDPANCRCCEAEAMSSNLGQEDEEELRLLDNGDAIQAGSPDDDFRFPSPVKNLPIQETSDKEMSSFSRTGSARSKAASAGSCGRKTSDNVRKLPVKSATSAKGTKSTTSTEITRKTNIVNYMVSRSTSPAERVKYFRNRLMKMYGTETVEIQTDGNSGLPPLLVQSLNSPRTTTPPKQRPATSRETAKSPTRSLSPSRQAWTGGWRPGHQRTNSNVKPKKIMLLHSPPL